ncbi:MAG: 1-(5-phosphoribosyl)-5-((5-phosphoribosylamino)methylideneamino)imidazole-4-carboxamide isomerase [Gammaproteobacteria bacterium RBG_16_57_12]|nr:MAG: 1-(5-phosphoribosyl)-5-((5-phosphoribosylamino)methylideneamino)imidazole-4-carboxamide isomerase [Gammaproteobacteria bacterium RBG_16_57_12]
MNATEPLVPTELTLHQKSRMLAVSFSDGERYQFSCEFLRVHSPSAEVRGHGAGQEVLQTGKERVNISKIEPVGNYGVKLFFDDGHNTGIYSWEYLHRLGQQQEQLWQDYLQRLKAAGHARRPASG